MLEKITQHEISLEKRFKNCCDREARYHELMAFGRNLPLIDPAHKTPQNLVSGCQSQMYVHATLQKDGTIYFTADADALISKGIAALLIYIYNNSPPEALIKHPPTILEKIGIYSSLSMNRSNGLRSLYLKMQQLSILLLSAN